MTLVKGMVDDAVFQGMMLPLIWSIIRLLTYYSLNLQSLSIPSDTNLKKKKQISDLVDSLNSDKHELISKSQGVVRK